MTVIIDYGAGNLYSISRSVEFLGGDFIVSSSLPEIEDAQKLILPGVGAFGDAMERLMATGLVPAIKKKARTGTPLLGICLGMQLLFEKSYEFGEHEGLSLIPGEICSLNQRLADEQNPLKVPHMGWNSLKIKRSSSILRNSKNGDYVYFVHSFYAKTDEENIDAVTEYGIDIPAVVSSDNTYGCQFHPEKSGEAGLKILKSFLDI